MTLLELVFSIDRFFFAYTVSTDFLGLLRIATCSLIIIDFFILRKDILSHILPNSLFPYNYFLRISSDSKYSNLSLFSIKYFCKSKKFSYIMLYLFYLSAFMSLFGIFTNVSLMILFIVYTSIQNRAIPIWSMAGDQVIKLLVLCLVFSKCGDKLSIDNLINLFSSQNEAPGWSIRFFQIYISWIYFSAAIAKTKDALWQKGEALKYSILNPGWGRRNAWVHKIFDNSFSKYLNYSIILLQFFAPLFLWLKDTRFIYILILMFFHLGITIFLNLGYFGPVFILSLATFLDPFFK